MFAADPLLCRDKGRWSSTTKVAEMAAPPGTFFNSIPSLRIYRNTIMYSDPIHQYIFWTESNGHCSPIPTITHLYLGAVISDFPLEIAFSQSSNIYRLLLQK